MKKIVSIVMLSMLGISAYAADSCVCDQQAYSQKTTLKGEINYSSLDKGTFDSAVGDWKELCSASEDKIKEKGYSLENVKDMCSTSKHVEKKHDLQAAYNSDKDTSTVAHKESIEKMKELKEKAAKDNDLSHVE